MGSPGTVDLYNDAVEKLGNQTFDWVNDNHRVALLGSGYTITQTHTQWSDISAQQVTGTGYSAGGKDLAGENIDVATDGTAKFDATDISWTGSTITARYAAVIVGLAATTTSTDPLVCVVALDTTTDVSSTAGTFKIQWNADGLFTLS